MQRTLFIYYLLKFIELYLSNPHWHHNASVTAVVMWF